MNRKVSRGTHDAWPLYRMALWLALLLSAVWIGLAWRMAQRDWRQHVGEYIHVAETEAGLFADGIALDLRSLLASKKGLAATLAHTPNVQQFVLSQCAAGAPAVPAQQINAYLTQTALKLGVDVLFLGNANGAAIASAHPERADSPIGHQYSDREYFQQARAGRIGQQYALGRTTGVHGLYFSAPILDAGRFCGFVVLKTNISSLSTWLSQADAFLADEHGVIIAAKDPRLELQTLPGATVAALPPRIAMARYGRSRFAKLNMSQLSDPDYRGLTQVEGIALPRIVRSAAIPEYGLKLVVAQTVGTLAQLDQDRKLHFQLAASLGVLAILSLVLAGAYVRQVRESRNRIRNAAERLEAAASAGIVGVWDWDVVHDRLVWDDVMYKLYGLRREDFGGAYEAWVHALHPDDKPRLEAEIQAALRGERQYAAEFRVVWPDGSIRYLKAVSRTTFDASQRPLRMVGVNYDLTEQKKIQLELDGLAYYDRLTKLPNRRLLEDRLDQAIALAKRERRQFALLFADLDKFKPVNDLYGHEAGDWLLQQVAARMLQSLRASDTAARIGGDEFIILLPGAAQAQDAAIVAEKIRAALERPFPMDDGTVLEISASIGVVMYPDHAANARDLLRFGDEAMYQAKQGGRNAVHIFGAAASPARIPPDGRPQPDDREAVPTED